MSTTRGAETPIALDPDGVPIVVDGVLAEDSAAADASESCVICVSRPRAVRFLPCGHASLCQLCTIQEMQRSGQCPVARCSVVQLVAVPVDPRVAEMATCTQEQCSQLSVPRSAHKSSYTRIQVSSLVPWPLVPTLSPGLLWEG